MPDSEPKKAVALINIETEALGDAAKLFIEKVSDAIGGLARPWQIRRVAQAEGDAAVISAEAEVRAEDVYRRATARWLNEEADKQVSMERIAANAVPQIREDAKPAEVDRDWLVNFFDKARLTSDEDMQQLWAKILAGEANTPGRFSKRTVNVMASLDKSDAEHFQSLSRFTWMGVGLHGATPIISHPQMPIFVKNEVTLSSVMRLCEAGLATFDTSPHFGGNEGFAMSFGPVKRISYAGSFYAVYPPEGRPLQLGRVGLTKAGADLVALCRASPIPEYRDSVLEVWSGQHAKVKAIQEGESVPDRIPNRVAPKV